MKKGFFVFNFVLIITVLFISCYTPSPLYGTWADNNGDKISFFDDGTFSATVVNNEDESIKYEGNYNCIDNVLVFSLTGDHSGSINTEWDIRGALLYLTWTESSNTKLLTLYHVAR